ncbi:DNA topoisomerase IB [Variovorax ginsengisoli]|uniref:DNA topoisomerase n=1 Tax=Variovorax ginsengisoli TaxID=363844 RepID=A0ABT9SGQ2_9BURK|nr:DNA topoisomerase IB [Variovorax ginsengisoli]MDP9902986.1 DNA topoisomerase-1 [Variovorax ginsengisoli]
MPNPTSLHPARLANGLVYVNPDMPGLRRFKRGASFRYKDAQGRWLSDADDIARIRSLAIPPAYTDVWICPLPHGHLQATGLDARGRKQYRYHADWRVLKDEAKFERLEAFGLALPRIRARVARDMKTGTVGAPLTRERVLATIVRLLDTTFLRVGNETYASSNGSFGLTTLRNHHAAVRGGALRLKFRGKSGVMHEATVDDARVARLVRRCQQLPGQELFQYQDDNGTPHGLSSTDVNDYLREAAGDNFTAKDFRTWHGTTQALELTRLACNAKPDSQAGTQALRYNAKEIIAAVARQLGNTPAVCKKAYVHPAVLSLGSTLADDAGAMNDIWQKISGGTRARRLLHAAEARLLAFLRAHRRNASVRAQPAASLKRTVSRSKSSV